MKFLLTSAGLQNGELAHALEELVGKPLSETSILFVITAGNTGSDDKRWLIKNLDQLDQYNFLNIDIIDFAGLPESIYQPHFEKADVICFGGGDERYLAQATQSIGSYLVPLLKSKVYMGISAGSMILGSLLSVSINERLFPEDGFASIESEGLSILPITFIPHLNSEYFANVRRPFLESLKDSFIQITYVVDDKTALKIDGDRIDVVGTGEYIVFNK